MFCKSLTNTIKIDIDGNIRPCCRWGSDPAWRATHNIKFSNILTWQSNKDLDKAKEQLAANVWPTQCFHCKSEEDNGITSYRQHKNQEFKDFSDSDLDIVLQPGYTCNMACQTCNSKLSSKIQSYEKKKSIIPIVPECIEDYSFLEQIKERIKKLTVAGGEPLYDKKSASIISWAEANTDAELIICTNGSKDVQGLISRCKKQPKIIFSLDGVGKLFEYIRFDGEWPIVSENYKNSLNKNAHITAYILDTIYNYHHIPDIVDFLLENPPDLVYFSQAQEELFHASAVPNKFKPQIISNFNNAIDKVNKAEHIEKFKPFLIRQLNDLKSKITNTEFNVEHHTQWVEHVAKNDSIRNTSIQDFDKFLFEMFSYRQW